MRQTLNRVLLPLAAMLSIASFAAAQEARTVRGKVTEAEGKQPLAGVQVTVKGTTTGTLTNVEGNFTLRVPANATRIVFTYIGYRTLEVPVSPQITATLERQAIGLEGIVVTALGVKREKRSLGYSVQDLTAAELNKVPEVNLVNAVQGQVAGVKITDAGPTGGTSRILIRGASSIAGDNQPLFVIDGIPVDNSSNRNSGFGGIDYGNTIQDLNAANIESISILKGANAAALYGSRASHGAVVITTKSGSGVDSRGLGIVGTSSYTFEEPLRLPNYQNLYGQGSGGAFQFVDGAGEGTWDFVDESWGPKLDGRLIDQFTGKQMPWVAHPDNVRNFFRTGATWNTTVAVSRAGERSNVRLSLNGTAIDGMAPGAEIDRIGVAVKGSSQITDKLTTEASLNYMNQEAKNRMGTGYDEDNPMQSFIWFGRQNDMEALRNFRCAGTEPTPCNPDGGQYNWNYNYHNNPFWEQLVNTNGDERDRVIGHVQASYQLSDWITATGRVGRDWYRDHRKAVTAFNSLDDAGDGGFDESTRYRAETNADVLFTASRQLSEDITLSATAGGNLRQNDYSEAMVQVSALTAPGIYSIDNAAATPNPTDDGTLKKVRSGYGSLNANYKGWLNLDVTGRNDWSSTLPEGNRSYFYPSVSGAFVFSDALKVSSDLFSSGKVRASWTRVGNDTDPYQLSSVYSAQQAWGAVPMFAVPNQLPNMTLKPEETTAFEVGADLGFFRERLGFVLTYYDNKTRNQILGVQISSTTGYTSQILNAGEVQNKGWELLLRATPIQMEDGFQWDMTVNWSKNDNKVTELFGDLKTIVLGTYWSMNIEARKGEPYGVMYGNGYLKCKMKDGKITAPCTSPDQEGMRILDSRGRPRADAERRILGNYNPDWNGGIQNRFAYKAFELSVLVDGQMGGDIFSTTNWFGEYAGVLQSSTRGREEDFCKPGIVVNGILPDGTVNGDGANDKNICPEAYFHRNFGNQETGIDDASYVKLREVRVGYRLPSSVVSWLGFSGGDVALIGRNLGLWSRIENIDPETAFDASNIQGIEFGQMPTARSLGFSISIRP